MPESIIVALITAAVSIFTVLLSARETQSKTQQMLKESQAITSNEIRHIYSEMSEMKADLKEHNNYAKRMPVIEERLSGLIQRVDKVEGKVEYDHN